MAVGWGGRAPRGIHKPISQGLNYRDYPKLKSLSGIFQETAETRVPRGACTWGDSRPNAPRTSCSLVTEPRATDRRASPPWVPPPHYKTIPNPNPATKARGPGRAASQAQARPIGRRSPQATPTLGLPGKATKDTSTTASTASSSCDPSLRSTEQVGRRREEAGGGGKKKTEENRRLLGTNRHHRVPQETDTKWPTASFSLHLPSATAPGAWACHGRVT